MSVVAPASTVLTNVLLTAGQTVTPPIDLTHVVGGALYCPAALAATAIRFLVDTEGGAIPAQQLVILANTVLTTPAAPTTWTPLPAALFGFRSAALQLAAGEAADRLFILALTKRQSNWRPKDGTILSGSLNGLGAPTGAAVAGAVILPAGLTGTALTWQISGDGNVWTTAKDMAGANVVQTYAAPAKLPIPAGVLNAPYIRGAVAGAQAANRHVEYRLRVLG